jgi:Zn-dependent protease
MWFNILVVAPPLLIAVMLHEIAHGWMAGKLGDPTARLMGRITLNPIAHIDLFMTIILPGLLIISGSPIVFGGAKPVPVDPRYFKEPRRGMLWVAAAGPVVNFILAGLSLILLKVVFCFAHFFPYWVTQVPVLMCAHSAIINVVLGSFNLLPVPPLDGGRIAVGILPPAWAAKWARLERYGILLVLVLLYFGLPQLMLEPMVELVMDIANQIYDSSF